MKTRLLFICHKKCCLQDSGFPYPHNHVGVGCYLSHCSYKDKCSSVHCAYRGRLEYVMKWMSAHVTYRGRLTYRSMFTYRGSVVHKEAGLSVS
ncbi:UNVERIFIED_CONTAM: hypothetical protein NCL1_33219 [Trichonephila clavipes]